MQWHSPIPISEQHLEKKRRHFWKLAPLSGGRPIIWNAIKSAISNPELSQSILESMHIVSNPELGEFYDWQGWRYLIPKYCLTNPDNLIYSVDKFTYVNNMETALVDDLMQNPDITVICSIPQKVFRICSGQSVKNVKDRIAKTLNIKIQNVIILRLGKILPDDMILIKPELEIPNYQTLLRKFNSKL